MSGTRISTSTTSAAERQAITASVAEPAWRHGVAEYRLRLKGLPKEWSMVFHFMPAADWQPALSDWQTLGIAVDTAMFVSETSPNFLPAPAYFWTTEQIDNHRLMIIPPLEGALDVVADAVELLAANASNVTQPVAGNVSPTLIWPTGIGGRGRDARTCVPPVDVTQLADPEQDELSPGAAAIISGAYGRVLDAVAGVGNPPDLFVMGVYRRFGRPTPTGVSWFDPFIGYPYFRRLQINSQRGRLLGKRIYRGRHD